MTGGPRTSVPGVVGRHLMLRLRTLGHEVRTLVGETSGEVRASFVAVGHAHAAEPHHVHEHHLEHLDDSAGGEFVDDQIRLRE